MASVTEGTVLRIVAVMLFPDDTIMQNVFHAVLTTVVGDNDSLDIVEDMVDYIEKVYTDIGAGIDADVSTSEVIVYEYDSIDDDFDEVGRDVWVLPTGVTGTMMPHGVAALLNLYTTDPDVSGKKYFGGLTEDGLRKLGYGG